MTDQYVELCVSSASPFYARSPEMWNFCNLFNAPDLINTHVPPTAKPAELTDRSLQLQSFTVTQHTPQNGMHAKVKMRQRIGAMCMRDYSSLVNTDAIYLSRSQCHSPYANAPMNEGET